MYKKLTLFMDGPSGDAATEQPLTCKKENLELKLRSLFFLKMSHLIQAQAMG